MQSNFLTNVTISLFDCWEKLFILMNIWWLGKHQMNDGEFMIDEWMYVWMMNVWLMNEECMNGGEFINY